MSNPADRRYFALHSATQHYMRSPASGEWSNPPPPGARVRVERLGPGRTRRTLVTAAGSPIVAVTDTSQSQEVRQ